MRSVNSRYRKYIEEGIKDKAQYILASAATLERESDIVNVYRRHQVREWLRHDIRDILADLDELENLDHE